MRYNYSSGNVNFLMKNDVKKVDNVVTYYPTYASCKQYLVCVAINDHHMDNSVVNLDVNTLSNLIKEDKLNDWDL